MAFRKHPTENRVIDYERGMELVSVGAGPMAYTTFSISGLEVPDWFWASQTITPESRGLLSTYSGDPMWKIIIQTDYSDKQRAEYEPIVAEAMMAYHSICDRNATSKRCYVEFLPWGTDYEERDMRGKRYSAADLLK